MGKQTKEMKAIHVTKSGGPEVLELIEVSMPKFDKHQVLIKVSVAEC